MIYKTLHMHKNINNDLQNTTHTQKKTKDRATGIPLKTGRELGCSGKEYMILVYLGRTRVLRKGIEDSSLFRENMGTPERYRGF
jgi:hypothetical protein